MSNFKFIYNSNPLSTDIYAVQDSLTPTQLIEIDHSVVIVGATISETIQTVVFYIENAYNTTNLYVITPDYINNEILIEANNANSSFTEDSNNSAGRVTTNISNTPGAGTFTIDSIVLSQADSDPCNNVKLTIATTPQASDITSPIVDTVGSNPYVTDIQRVGETVVTMNDSDGNDDSEKLFLPALVSADFSVDIVLAPNSGTATIINNYTRTPAFTLEYSLDNVTWYQSNSFSGLSVGNYTAYVRDGIGCDFSLAFEITDFSPTIDPRVQYSFVSNSGSFRFKVVQDLTTNIPTVYNTLSYEENVDNNNSYYIQPYEIGDGIVMQQFKSSYETNEAVIIDCDGTETALIVDQKTQNINIEDVRDGKVISTDYLNQNYVAVQFGSGNTYDPVTLLENGTYSLGNELPDWIDIGEYLNIQNAGWTKVIDIIRIDGVNTAIMNYLVDSYPETIPQQGLSRRITSVYNQLPYEVYEFSVNMGALSGSYQIRIDLTDSEFTSVSYLSEWISVKEKHEKTHLVQWYNTINNEINYSTGITNTARFRYIYNMQWLPNDNQEVFIANTNTVQIESTVRNFYTIKLFPIPTAMNQKFNLLCANDRIFIDGINFIRETEPETIYFNSTNLYQINQQLTEAEYKFASTLSDGSVEVDCGTSLAIQDVGEGLLLIEDN